MKKQSTTTTTASVSQNNASLGAPVGAQSAPTEAAPVLRQPAHELRLTLAIQHVNRVPQSIHCVAAMHYPPLPVFPGLADDFTALFAAAPALRDALASVMTWWLETPGPALADPTEDDDMPPELFDAAQAALALAGGAQEPAADSSVERELRRDLEGTSRELTRVQGQMNLAAIVLRDLVASFAAYEAGAISLDTFENDARLFAARAESVLVAAPVRQSVNVVLLEALRGLLQERDDQLSDEIDDSETVKAARAAVAEAEAQLKENDEAMFAEQAKAPALDPIVSLECCCCGSGTKGRQWWNRDTGYGLCHNCITYCGVAGVKVGDTAESYGVRGVHWDVSESR